MTKIVCGDDLSCVLRCFSNKDGLVIPKPFVILISAKTRVYGRRCPAGADHRKFSMPITALDALLRRPVKFASMYYDNSMQVALNGDLDRYAFIAFFERITRTDTHLLLRLLLTTRLAFSSISPTLSIKSSTRDIFFLDKRIASRNGWIVFGYNLIWSNSRYRPKYPHSCHRLF